MQENYIQDALVQFIYRDTPTDDIIEMSALIATDRVLNGSFKDLLSAKAQLPKVQFNPSPAALQNILQYSRQVQR
jgi:hypothetical protein